jgi:hypothetical protein
MSNPMLDAANAEMDRLWAATSSPLGHSTPHQAYTTLDGIYVRSDETETQARAEHDQHHAWKRAFGSPEYGGWRNSLVDGKHKPIEICEAEEARALSGRVDV